MPFDILLSRDDLEGLPETVAITDLYEQDDEGKYRFVPKIEGMKPASELDRVMEALRKEKGDHKKVKDRYRAFGDRDPDEVLAQLDEIEELRSKLEAQGDLPDDKIDEIVNKRIGGIKAPLERSISSLTEERDAALADSAEKAKKLNDLIIGQKLTELASKHCNPEVQRDVVEIGRSYLVVDDEGNVVTKDEAPIPAEEWIRAQLEDRNHWNKESGGGNGGRGPQGGGRRKANPFSADNVDWSTGMGRWKPGALAAQDAYLAENGRDAWRSAALAAGANPDRPGSLPSRPTPNGRAA